MRLLLGEGIMGDLTAAMMGTRLREVEEEGEMEEESGSRF